MTNNASFDLSKAATFTIITEGYAASPASGILSVDDVTWTCWLLLFGLRYFMANN